MAARQKKRSARAAFKEEATSPITKYFSPAAASSRLKASPGAGIKSPSTAKPILVDVTSTSLVNPLPNVFTPMTPPKVLRANGGKSVVNSPDVFDVCTPTLPQRFKKRISDQKPMTPSSTMKSSMNNSLVFDIVTSLSTNDPDVATSALRSVVALGKEFPTPLLFEELLDLMQNESTYARAVAIFSSMIFVFEQASQCHTTMAFPAQWTRMNDILCDVVLKPMDDKWRRSLLALQFLVHYFQKDMAICKERYAATNKDWIGLTRLSLLLGDHPKADAKPAKKGRTGVQNNAILAALGRIVELWVRVYDYSSDEDGGDAAAAMDAREGCVAAMRLLEMLLHLTDQKDNAMQKIQMGLQPMQRSTRRIFLQTMQSHTYKMMLATTVLGRTTLSRSKEFEWFGCIAEEACVAHTVHHSSQRGTDETRVDAAGDLRRFAAIHLQTYQAKATPPPLVHQLFQGIAELQRSSK